MKQELTEKLYIKYPAIFAQHCGFEHSDGWYGIIDTLCEALSEGYIRLLEVDEERAKGLGIACDEDSGKYWLEVQPPQIVALQVKEKFATLRFYYALEFDPRFEKLAFGDQALPAAQAIASEYRSFYHGILHYAIILSAKVCEVTGRAGELHTTSGEPFGWRRTLNREFAQSDPICRSRDYQPIKLQGNELSNDTADNKGNSPPTG